MAIKKRKPTSPGTRHRSDLSSVASITKKRPEKSLVKGAIKKTGGRNTKGRITVRHRGGGHKKLLRSIDFKRDKHGITGTVRAIEYDPNRWANIALIYYSDGEKRYILAPMGLKIGDKIMAGEKARIRVCDAFRSVSIAADSRE